MIATSPVRVIASLVLGLCLVACSSPRPQIAYCEAAFGMTSAIAAIELAENATALGRPDDASARVDEARTWFAEAHAALEGTTPAPSDATWSALTDADTAVNEALEHVSIGDWAAVQASADAAQAALDREEIVLPEGCLDVGVL
jgi:hypothetical protein